MRSNQARVMIGEPDEKMSGHHEAIRNLAATEARMEVAHGAMAAHSLPAMVNPTQTDRPHQGGQGESTRRALLTEPMPFGGV